MKKIQLTDRRTSLSAAMAPSAALARGFTLIELLVVIAILAVLASLLLPAVLRVKAYAGTLKCRNNLRQFSMLMTVYVNDYGTYPNFSWATHARLWFNRWEPGTPRLQLREDYENAPRCPVESRWPAEALGPGSDPPPNYPYWYNTVGSKDPGPPVAGNEWRWGLGLVKNSNPPVFYPEPVSGIPVPESEVIAPADMVAFTEMATRKWPIKNGYGLTAPHEGLEYAYPHSDSVGVSFCDGHTEQFTRQDFAARSDNFWKRWNRDHQPHPETW